MCTINTTAAYHGMNKTQHSAVAAGTREKRTGCAVQTTRWPRPPLRSSMSCYTQYEDKVGVKKADAHT